jgi:hypothetical protein
LLAAVIAVDRGALCTSGHSRCADPSYAATDKLGDNDERRRNMSHARTLAICAIGVVCSTYAFGGQVLSRYRNFEFDSNVTSISALAGLAPSEAKVIHQQPAVFQNLEWRPSHWIVESTAESTDPVETVLFSFYDDQLFRVVVDYRRKRTEGMTGADMN